MKKIMFMINSLYGGGAEKILQNIISNMDCNKYDITLYSLHQELFNNELYKGKVTYRFIFNNKKSFLRKIQGWIFCNLPTKVFYRLYIHEKYDIEVAFIEGESTKIISGSSNKNSKKIAWVHVDLLDNPWTSFIYRDDEDEKNHYNAYDQIVCVSDSVKHAFCKKYGVDKNKVKTQYNPIDEKEILSNAKQNCKLPSKKRIRMIAVGRLVRQKGFDRLLRIVYKLKSEGFDFELFILGEGAERKVLEHYIYTHELTDRVNMLGFQENPYPYMLASDMMICSSRAEGFSTVATEGVVLGLPIISTDCAGIRELFGDEQCGIITENTEDALYCAIRHVLEKPECLEIYSKASLIHGQIFSLKKSMNEIEKIFEIK